MLSRLHSSHQIPVVAGGIVHRQEGEKLAEGGLLVIPVDILHNDALPEYLVSEGGEESVHGMSCYHEPSQLPLFVLKAVNVFLLCISAHKPLLNLLHL